MKKQENEVRDIFVKVRMNAAELQEAKKNQRHTTERSLSNYIRKLVLQKPVIVKYRNQTADDFLTDMLLLKKELNAIGNNFNQAVKKLHVLEKIPEFRFWITYYDGMQKSLLAKVSEIQSRVNELYEQWLQK